MEILKDKIKNLNDMIDITKSLSLDGPYFSIDFIKKNILKISESDIRKQKIKDIYE